MRLPIHSGWSTVSGCSSRPTPAGVRTAGADAAAASREPAHSHDGQIGAGACPAMPAIAVAPIAATSTSAIRPSTRSVSTTIVATVFEPAGRAVSRMRITSPPMLLGRKLLKKSATRSDPRSVRSGIFTPCASSSRFQRHALASTLTA